MVTLTERLLLFFSCFLGGGWLGSQLGLESERFSMTLLLMDVKFGVAGMDMDPTA